MKLNLVSLTAQNAVSAKMEKYASVYDGRAKKEYSSNPIIFRGFENELDYLRTSSKAIAEEKEILEQEIEEKFSEVAKVSSEAIEELEKASYEAEKYFENRQFEINNLSKSILARYEGSNGKMSETETKRLLLGVLGNVNVSLPQSLRSKMGEAASKLGTLSSLTAELSCLAGLDEGLTHKLDSNNINAARIQLITGESLVGVDYKKSVSLGRFLLGNARLIDSSVSSLYSNIDFNNHFSSRRASRVKDQQLDGVKPKAEPEIEAETA